ncbi:MAG: PAS domain-containing protein [Kordiimonadaceae bacterium]|jgi:hypothetical protein|nr:PAS domain-containing protein [Kordiimonadaceae bacterium]MBT6031061.1 PAS domain-containing protein [Kordiimonadaceae bacterium]
MDEDVKILESFEEQDFTAPFQFELYNYWCNAKGDRNLPARSDIKIEELAAYLSSLILLDYNPKNSSFIARVIGTSCVKVYGEMTNESMNDYEEHKPAAKRLLWCIENKKPYYAVKNLANINKDYIKTSFIVLPLSEDGENVNKILVSHHFY